MVGHRHLLSKRRSRQMTFPDQSHINRVRDALHQRAGNGASVMIGSGFSKNAEKISLDAHRNARLARFG